jgi:hypothetical protein
MEATPRSWLPALGLLDAPGETAESRRVKLLPVTILPASAETG